MACVSQVIRFLQTQLTDSLRSDFDYLDESATTYETTLYSKLPKTAALNVIATESTMTIAEDLLKAVYIQKQLAKAEEDCNRKATEIYNKYVTVKE